MRKRFVAHATQTVRSEGTGLRPCTWQKQDTSMMLEVGNGLPDASYPESGQCTQVIEYNLCIQVFEHVTIGGVAYTRQLAVEFGAKHISLIAQHCESPILW